MLFVNYFKDLASLIVVFNDLAQVFFVRTHFLFHFFHNKNLIAFLFVDAFGQFGVNDFLDLLVVSVSQVQHLLVVSPCLVVLDV